MGDLRHRRKAVTVDSSQNLQRTALVDSSQNLQRTALRRPLIRMLTVSFGLLLAFLVGVQLAVVQNVQANHTGGGRNLLWFGFSSGFSFRSFRSFRSFSSFSSSSRQTCDRGNMCSHSGSVYAFVDCDGDGTKEHTCYDQKDYGIKKTSSYGGCVPDTWPSEKRSNCEAAWGCSRPVNWCTGSGSRYEQFDCNGDGVMDHTCQNTDTQEKGVILAGSRAGCKADTWPRAVTSDCPVIFKVQKQESCIKEKGFCVRADGGDQNAGVFKLEPKNFVRDITTDDGCLEACGIEYVKRGVKMTGCERIWNQNNTGCYLHTEAVDRGNGVNNHFCWIQSKCVVNGCKKDPGWCYHIGSKYTFADCDGDGEKDHVCEDLSGSKGIIFSKSGVCQPHTWPNALHSDCPIVFGTPTIEGGASCSNRCFVTISTAECPADADLKRCDDSSLKEGDLCESDGECNLPEANNCFNYDVHKLVPCGSTRASSPTQLALTSKLTLFPTSSPTLISSCNYKRTDLNCGGNDIQDCGRGQSLKECEQCCTDRSDCTGFVLSKAGGHCLLKTGTCTTPGGDGTWPYYPKGACSECNNDPYEEYPKKCKGMTDLNNGVYHLSSVEQCQKQCTQLDDCKGVHAADGLYCYLLSTTCASPGDDDFDINYKFYKKPANKCKTFAPTTSTADPTSTPTTSPTTTTASPTTRTLSSSVSPTTGTCLRPSNWCSHLGSTYTFVDCDGDGERDHVCGDTAGQKGIIFSKSGVCQTQTWPNAVRSDCPVVFGHAPTSGTKQPTAMSTTRPTQSPIFSGNYLLYTCAEKISTCLKSLNSSYVDEKDMCPAAKAAIYCALNIPTLVGCDDNSVKGMVSQKISSLLSIYESDCETTTGVITTWVEQKVPGFCRNDNGEAGSTLRGPGTKSKCERYCASHPSCMGFTYATGDECILYFDVAARPTGFESMGFFQGTGAKEITTASGYPSTHKCYAKSQAVAPTPVSLAPSPPSPTIKPTARPTLTPTTTPSDGSCKRPKDFCTFSGAVYQHIDCLSDGTMDHVCLAADKDMRGVVYGLKYWSGSCSSNNWPNAKHSDCPEVFGRRQAAQLVQRFAEQAKTVVLNFTCFGDDYNNFCTKAGEVKMFMDCNGDGMIDMACSDEKGNRGVITSTMVSSSGTDCKDHTDCPSQLEMCYKDGNICVSGVDDKCKCKLPDSVISKQFCKKSTWPNATVADCPLAFTNVASSSTCTKPANWCTSAGSIYNMIDCNEDGKPDHVCIDTTLAGLKFVGIDVRADGSCGDTWGGSRGCPPLERSVLSSMDMEKLIDTAANSATFQILPDTYMNSTHNISMSDKEYYVAIGDVTSSSLSSSTFSSNPALGGLIGANPNYPQGVVSTSESLTASKLEQRTTEQQQLRQTEVTSNPEESSPTSNNAGSAVVPLVVITILVLLIVGGLSYYFCYLKPKNMLDPDKVLNNSKYFVDDGEGHKVYVAHVVQEHHEDPIYYSRNTIVAQPNVAMPMNEDGYGQTMNGDSTPKYAVANDPIVGPRTSDPQPVSKESYV